MRLHIDDAVRDPLHDSSYGRVADLLDVGARKNPRRPFVFVSRVLGKHLPCSASRIRRAQRMLAAELGPEPALVIGMAETATGLGEGVFSAWQALTASSGLYLSTTRYPIHGATAVDFTEAHSHATRLRLYAPDSEAGRRLLASVRRVVLVDDEISTGDTFASLVLALRGLAPRLTTIDMVALTDFSGGNAARQLRALPGIAHVRVHALLAGSFAFQAHALGPAAAAPAQRAIGCRRARMMAATPRCGITRAPRLCGALPQAATRLAAGKSVRLIATGECMYPAQCLGEHLEERGVEVALQSTTRSPLLRGGPIRSSQVVTDPYGEGIDNYIYNLPDPCAAEVRIIVHETGDTPEIRRLCDELGAVALDIDSAAMIRPSHNRALV